MIQNSPFEEFTDKINKDLLAWTLQKQELEALVKDYEGTLNFVEKENGIGQSCLVDVSDDQGVLCEGRRLDNNIIIRVKNDLYVEFKPKEAQKVIQDLIGFYKDKINVAENEIRKIMVSMKEVEELIQQYSSLV